MAKNSDTLNPKKNIRIGKIDVCFKMLYALKSLTYSMNLLLRKVNREVAKKKPMLRFLYFIFY